MSESAQAAAREQEAQRGHNAPAYVLSIGGRDISPRIAALLMRLTLTEKRGDAADQLEIELDDSSGRINIPPAGEKLALRLGWQGSPLMDKGEFVVDEVEHRGAPDVLTIRARSADMRSALRERREASYHKTTLGQIVQRVAQRHGLRARVAPPLAGVQVAHIDQTHESDLNFLTRLGRRWDAVATIKKGTLIFQGINARATATGAQLGEVLIERRQGDDHRWHRAGRQSRVAGQRTGAQARRRGGAKGQSQKAARHLRQRAGRNGGGAGGDAAHRARRRHAGNQPGFCPPGHCPAKRGASARLWQARD